MFQIQFFKIKHKKWTYIWLEGMRLNWLITIVWREFANLRDVTERKEANEAKKEINLLK
jgi:hypothetical protein